MKSRVPISEAGSIALADPPVLNGVNVLVDRVHKIVSYTHLRLAA